MIEEPKLAMLIYRLPPMQQVAIFRIFPMIGYYLIGLPKRGLLFFVGVYPAMVMAQSIADTLANDLGWNVLISAFIGIMSYELWNYAVIRDVNKQARKL